jgi:hypothetical protein
MAFPWVRNTRGGGGDPFRDTSGRQVTNVRASIPASDALKEGMRESPGQLNMMDQNQYRAMLEDQMKQAKKYREAEEAELNATLWWEKKERREQAQQQIQQPPMMNQNQHLPNVNNNVNNNMNNNVNNNNGRGRQDSNNNYDSRTSQCQVGFENNHVMATTQIVNNGFPPPLLQDGTSGGGGGGGQGQRWMPPINQQPSSNMRPQSQQTYSRPHYQPQQPQQPQPYQEERGGRPQILPRPTTASYSEPVSVPSSARFSTSSTQRSDAMEILVIDNADLRRENQELKQLLARYQETFGPI